MSDFTLVHGDCRDTFATMADASVDAVITDIPYGGHVSRQHNVTGFRMLDKGDADVTTVPLGVVAGQCARIARGWVYVWCDWRQASPLMRLLERKGMGVRLGMWRKTDPSPMNGERTWLSGLETCVIGRHALAPFFRHCAVPEWRGPIERNIDWHPTPKPPWLMRELIGASVPLGGSVFDPFMGSGSVGVAALELGRQFIGCELKLEWFYKARHRIAGSQRGLELEA